MAYSKLLHKYYDACNNSSLYITNIKQVCMLLSSGAESDLVDILYTDAREDSLVFVFKRNEMTTRLLKACNVKQNKDGDLNGIAN